MDIQWVLKIYFMLLNQKLKDQDEMARRLAVAQRAPVVRGAWRIVICRSHGGSALSEVQEITVLTFHLEWSAWTDWKELLINATLGGIPISQRAGLYEARIKGQKERLTIGKTSKLHNRAR